MHYGQPTLYHSTLAAPGPLYGNHDQKTGNAASSGIWANGASQPLQLVNEVPTGNTQYYCKELNGTWQIRTYNDIMNNCQPVDRRTHSQTGVPFFERRANN